MNLKNLCNELITSETEQEVINLLQKYELWDNSNSWKFLGGNRNNFSVANNQSEDALGALVELLINGVDAVLIRKCKENGIDPKNKVAAPKSINEAVDQFFNSKLKTSELAEQTCGLVATGSKKNPSYGIFFIMLIMIFFSTNFKKIKRHLKDHDAIRNTILTWTTIPSIEAYLAYHKDENPNNNLVNLLQNSQRVLL